MSVAFFHPPESDALLIEGWQSGVGADALLEQINAVIAALPGHHDLMTASALSRRVQKFRLRRPPGYRSQKAQSVWQERCQTLRDGRIKASTQYAFSNPPNPALTAPKDGSLSVAVNEIAREIESWARCRIDRKSALEWGKRNCRIGGTPSLEEINAQRREHNLPVFEIA